jgi:hypothetical protein
MARDDYSAWDDTDQAQLKAAGLCLTARSDDCWQLELYDPALDDGAGGHLRAILLASQLATGKNTPDQLARAVVKALDFLNTPI